MTTATGDILSFTYDALKRAKQVQATDKHGTPIINTRYAYRSDVNSEGVPITTNQIQYHNVRIGDENDTVLVGAEATIGIFDGGFEAKANAALGVGGGFVLRIKPPQ